MNNIKKFVINLKKRPDRLKTITNELEYLGWDFELFEGIDLGSYMGCALSHLELIELAIKKGYEEILIIEDDSCVMPYAKDLTQKLGDVIKTIDYGVINLSPTLNRPVNVSNVSDLLIDLTDLPEKTNQWLRETYSTNMILYHNSVYDKILSLKDLTYPSGGFQYPIDEFLALIVYPNHQSFASVLPVAPQYLSESDVSGGVYNNFYTQTYNWNLYSPTKIPGEFLNPSIVEEYKSQKRHVPFN